MKPWFIILTAFILGVSIGIGSALVDVFLVRPAPAEQFRCPDGTILDMEGR